MAAATATAPKLYRPQRVAENVVVEVVRESLREFIEQAEAGDYSVPDFVKGELEALLACGDPSHGFAHLECPLCGPGRFLPFSCKSRTICSSCAGRRMNETTSFLVDHVIADIPVRHWALTFPPPLRYLLAYDTELCTEVLNVFVRTVFDWQRRVAKRELGLTSVKQATPAAVTAIHRVGSAINLNLHLHSVVTDVVFVQGAAGERPVFRALPAPEKTEVIALAWDVCQKTTRMLQKLGRYFDADPDADRLAQDHPLLAQCYAASLQGFVAVGDRVGQRVQRSGRTVEHGESDSIEQVRTLGHGFNLHAGVRVSAGDKKGRERVLRYVLRPPIASKRLTRGKDGRVTYRLKEAWADGSKCRPFRAARLRGQALAVDSAAPCEPHSLSRRLGAACGDQEARGAGVDEGGRPAHAAARAMRAARRCRQLRGCAEARGPGRGAGARLRAPRQDFVERARQADL